MLVRLKVIGYFATYLVHYNEVVAYRRFWNITEVVHKYIDDAVNHFEHKQRIN